MMLTHEQVVKRMGHLPQDVDAFFRQVATAHRLLSDGYAGMRHLTTEAEQHMYDLLHHLQTGETVCGKIEARGTMSGAALAIADSKALKQAADGVAKSLGLCVAEVAADAMPRLNQLQRQLSKASVLTAADKAKLDNLPLADSDAAVRAIDASAPSSSSRPYWVDSATGQSSWDRPAGIGSHIDRYAAAEPEPEPATPEPAAASTDETLLQRTSTREELALMKQEMKRIKENEKRMESELARKQDAEHGADHAVSVSVGGGSMQMQQASATAKAAHRQLGSSEAQGATAQQVQQVQQQVTELQSVAARMEDQLHEVRVHTGLELSLSQAVDRIREALGLDAGMKMKAVVSEAQDQLDLEFADGAPMKVRVQRVCGEFGIETGWATDEPAQTASLPADLEARQAMSEVERLVAAGELGAAEDEVKRAERLAKQALEREQLFGGGGGDDDDIC
eukprot:COSAG02_NODE_553_length_20425_cov_17.986372_13_plen_451_part_00